jgi:drug/metabolite transporter (DMT)-like permease
LARTIPARARGMPAGTAAMLVGLQPIVTVFIARSWLGERTTLRQWVGLALGLLGVYCVVEHKVRLVGNAIATSAIIVALIAIRIGTLYQKRHAANFELRADAVIQFGACAALFAVVAPLFESLSIAWTWQFQFALAWSVIVLSVGAVSLLYWMLRRGAAADVARLFYMVPGVTMLMAFALFEEPITWLAVLGLVLIAAGVVLAACSESTIARASRG